MPLLSIFSFETIRGCRPRVDALAVVAVGLLVAAELGFRAASVVTPHSLPQAVIQPERNGYYPPPHVFDREIGFRFEPNYRGELARTDYTNPLILNSFGFHAREWSADKSPDSIRVILLGDSFLMAGEVQIEQTWASILETLLHPINGRKVEILNCGLAGYSTWNMRQALEKRLLALHPDIVILWGSYGSLVSPAERYFSRTRGGRILSSPNADALMEAVKRENSDAFSLRRLMMEHLYSARFAAHALNKKTVGASQRAPVPGPSPKHPFNDQVREMRDLCARAGAGFGVFYRGKPPRPEDNPCVSLRIPAGFDDPKILGRKDLGWDHDPHFNLQGNRIYAETIAPAMQGLIEAAYTVRR
ncbi:SGNH/GDSL hydrolase family protein [Candidatus Sumerlaeota bacterium]|nr:SGNH/GDSL hydrolase family protein [Candidatus Sumerlaeota bacterium]